MQEGQNLDTSSRRYTNRINVNRDALEQLTIAPMNNYPINKLAPEGATVGRDYVYSTYVSIFALHLT
jgi:hypothetical protein